MINDQWATFELDDRHHLEVPKNDLNACLQAMQDLRKSKPGMTFDTNTYAISHTYVLVTDWQRDDTVHSYDTAPDRHATWLPTSSAPWMNASARADFTAQGGWAQFDAASWMGKTVSF